MFGKAIAGIVFCIILPAFLSFIAVMLIRMKYDGFGIRHKNKRIPVGYKHLRKQQPDGTYRYVDKRRNK